jgi:hypothetical protein
VERKGKEMGWMDEWTVGRKGEKRKKKKQKTTNDLINKS